jgi:cytochrome P450
MLTRPPSLNANSNSAAYWTIVNLHNHPDILVRVREEIKPYAKREGKDKRLSLDWQGLLNDCPLLKASYFESLRMDSAPWSFKTLQRDVQIKEEAIDFRRNNGSTTDSKGAAAVFKLRKGDVALIPADLHHTDPVYFPAPKEFDPWRYISRSDGVERANIGTIRPYGGGSTMCKGRLLAEREVVSYVAAVLTCWDLKPVDGSHWGMHKQTKTSGVCAPGDDLRVDLTPRP